MKQNLVSFFHVIGAFSPPWRYYSCHGRAAKEEAKKREQQQAMMANRGMYMASAVNGSAAGGGHVPTLSYGTRLSCSAKARTSCWVIFRSMSCFMEVVALSRLTLG